MTFLQLLDGITSKRTGQDRRFDTELSTSQNHRVSKASVHYILFVLESDPQGLAGSLLLVAFPAPLKCVTHSRVSCLPSFLQISHLQSPSSQPRL